MRTTIKRLTLVSLLVIESLNSSLAQPAQPAPTQPTPFQTTPSQAAPGCAQIVAACRQAGFVEGGSQMGVGIVADCIRPIMVGTPRRVAQGSMKPLPKIDPQVVAACKQQNPNFGIRRQRSQPDVQPTNKP